MNPIRNAAPNLLLTASRRASRLATAAILFTGATFGATSCSDSNLTEPFVRPNTPESYDSATPPELKLFNQTGASEPTAALTPLRSASAASAASAAAVSVSNITFAPLPGPFAKPQPGCDDCMLGPLPIGFSFRFFGNTYSQFYVSTNGFVTFTPIGPNPTHPQRLAGCCEGRSLPVVDEINNLIAIAWDDLAPINGQLAYETRGTAPNRRLIVNYAGVRNLNEFNRPVTAQLILYEGTNDVEIHTKSASAVNFNLTQGLENHAGLDAAFLAGRVAAKYTLANDGVRFSGAGGNAVPVAIPGGNAGTAPNKFYEGVEGAAIEFKGSGADADNDQLTYSWDFNKDGVADAETANASYTFADNSNDNVKYTAVLTVNDGKGGINQASVDVVVKNALPVVSAGSDVRINAGETVSFSGRFSDAGVRDNPWGWTWNIGSDAYYFDNTETQTEPILGSHRFCKAGKFPAKLTVKDKDGGVGSDELEVTVDALPVDIDVNPNTINLNGSGHAMITVRIFSRAGLDATTLNPDAIKLTNGFGRGTQLARTGGGLWHWNADADLNGDGLLDVVAGFRRDEMIKNEDLGLNTTELKLSGQVGTCGDVLGKAEARVKVQSKEKSAASSLQPTGEAATPIDPSTP
jgi:hypothetical protein